MLFFESNAAIMIEINYVSYISYLSMKVALIGISKLNNKSLINYKVWSLFETNGMSLLTKPTLIKAMSSIFPFV